MMAQYFTGHPAQLTAPADGDDYSYFPRKGYTPPLIPSQFVPPTEYQALAIEVERLRHLVNQLAGRVAVLERQAEQWTGE